ncbi:velvet factor [Mycena olivaceomarginata]|nr:velvet factor [Mycena olivaceomarginata]
MECPRSYQLNVVQQPQKTAEFANASLSRLPLTPPLLVQLTVTDLNGNSIVPEEELPFLVAHLSLFTEGGIASLDMGSSTIGPREAASQPILYGSLVASVDQLEDLNGNMGLFFLFPDVSIRWRGRFRLRVNLVRICRQPSSGNTTNTDIPSPRR